MVEIDSIKRLTKGCLNKIGRKALRRLSSFFFVASTKHPSQMAANRAMWLLLTCQAIDHFISPSKELFKRFFTKYIIENEDNEKKTASEYRELYYLVSSCSKHNPFQSTKIREYQSSLHVAITKQ